MSLSSAARMEEKSNEAKMRENVDVNVETKEFGKEVKLVTKLEEKIVG